MSVLASPGLYQKIRHSSAECKLAAGIILQTLRDVAGMFCGVPEEQRTLHQAEALLWLREDNPEPGGYRWCCEAIGIKGDSLTALMEDPGLVQRLRYRQKRRLE